MSGLPRVTPLPPPQCYKSHVDLTRPLYNVLRACTARRRHLLRVANPLDDSLVLARSSNSWRCEALGLRLCCPCGRCPRHWPLDMSSSATVNLSGKGGEYTAALCDDDGSPQYLCQQLREQVASPSPKAPSPQARDTDLSKMAKDSQRLRLDQLVRQPRCSTSRMLALLCERNGLQHASALPRAAHLNNTRLELNASRAQRSLGQPPALQSHDRKAENGGGVLRRLMRTRAWWRATLPYVGRARLWLWGAASKQRPLSAPRILPYG